uniref:Homeobox domain-containing protein n=1 Tax=Panagrolaimus sp. ES5 TaxID=591445 RepID=A0AC34FSJ4_9BILA
MATSSQLKMDAATIQQFSQFMFLQSLASSSGNNSTMPSQFQQMPTLTMPPKMSSQIPSTPPMPSLSPSEQLNFDALAAISTLLSAQQNLKSQISPSFSSSPSGFSLNQMPSSIMNSNNLRSSPYQIYQQQQRQPEYRIAVTRESAKPLQEWMDQNIHHPYPTSADIQSLSKQTGFSHKQIRNWFTNNRRRFEQQSINQPLPWQKKPASNRKSSSPESLQLSTKTTSECSNTLVSENIKPLKFEEN